MPPRLLSTFALSSAIKANANGAKPDALILTDREPYRYRRLDDNRHHKVEQGDTLWNIAARYFAGASDRPAMFWRIVADFQPDPVHDPTIQLELGRVIVVPSLRTLREEILAEKRREEVEA